MPHITLIQAALCLLASFIGGGVYWLAAKNGADGWVSFALGLFAFSLVFVGAVLR